MKKLFVMSVLLTVINAQAANNGNLQLNRFELAKKAYIGTHTNVDRHFQSHSPTLLTDKIMIRLHDACIAGGLVGLGLIYLNHSVPVGKALVYTCCAVEITTLIPLEYLRYNENCNSDKMLRDIIKQSKAPQ